MLRDPAGWWKAWVKPAGLDYFPLKSLLQWVEWRLFGPHVPGYHGANLALHAGSSVLLWMLLDRLGVRLAWLGGLLFAVHPLAVESIAWIAEFKNALALPFLLSSVLLYLRWQRAPRFGYLAGSLVLFGASLLSKSTGAMLPFLLLVLGWWGHGRITRRDVLGAIPFFVVSAIIGSLTLHFQWSRAIVMPDAASFGQRVVRAGGALGWYARASVWPTGLSAVYEPYTSGVAGILGWVGLTLVTGACWAARHTWGRHALLVLAWFVLNLIPVLGIVEMAYMRVSPKADHFAYVSLLAVAGGMAAVASRVWSWARHRGRIVRCSAAAAMGAAPALLAMTARARAADFRDEAALWSAAVKREPDAWLARNNWGRVLLEQGKTGPALEQLRTAVALEPASAEARANLGNALNALGHPGDALREYRTAVALDPDFAGAHYDLGRELLVLGRTADAEVELRQAVTLDPGYVAARNNLGLALARLGRFREAAGEYEGALRLDPNLPEARLNLANALFREGLLEQAVAEYRETLRRHPDYVPARRNLAVALQALGSR